MRLSQLATKQLIDAKEGKKYGVLEHFECVIDPKSGKVVGFQLKDMQTIFKKNRDRYFIAWEDISLVGKDRILFHSTNMERDE